MKNQIYTGAPTGRRFALCPTTVVAGDAVLIGKEPAVALDSYSSLTGGTTFLLSGSFNISVVAKSGLSPSVGAAVGPGDKVYADGGTLDSGTNVTTGFTLDANSSGTLFGNLDPSSTKITSGSTDTAAIVKIGG